MLQVDVRFLGSGDIFEDLALFQVKAKLFDQEHNSYGNEIQIKFLLKRIEALREKLNNSWNTKLSKPLTPSKDYVFKKISPIENPISPIRCEICLKKTFLKTKKGYKIHCIKFHKNVPKPDFTKIPDDVEVSCMLSKEDGTRCTKSYDVDQIYR